MNQENEKTAVEKKLAKSGTRKLLALDGGGVRGMITIEILAEIEQTLRRLLGQGEDFVLADYFDYIAGTSIGAVLASCLSLGMSVNRTREFFLGNVRKLFKKAPLWKRWWYAYRADPVRKLFQRVVADVPLPGSPENAAGFHDTLGSPKLRTLLLLIMHNATTDSPWPISNNPHAKFNNVNLPDCNLRIPLWQLARASTAAPGYFPPEVLRIGSNTFMFEDGAITPFANPAFQLFLMATLPEYRLNWPASEEQMLLVSVGSGKAAHVNPAARPQGDNVVNHVRNVPSVLIGANVIYQDVLCRVFGKCLVGDPIDTEVGDLINSAGGPAHPKLFTYLRYDADLSDAGLAELGLARRQAAAVRRLDSISHLATLRAIGQAAATSVKAEHFAGFSR